MSEKKSKKTSEETNGETNGSLSLHRNAGEQIIIDGGIKITVVSARGKGVVLRFEAPKGIRINRAEVAERIKRERLADRGEWLPGDVPDVDALGHTV